MFAKCISLDLSKLKMKINHLFHVQKTVKVQQNLIEYELLFTNKPHLTLLHGLLTACRMLN